MAALIILLFVPYLASIALAFYFSGIAFSKLENRYQKYSQRFVLAIAIFFIIEFLLRKLVLLVFGLILQGGAGQVLGIAALAISSIGTFLVANLILLLFALLFAATKAKLKRPSLETPAVEHEYQNPTTNKIIFLVVVFFGLTSFFGPKILSNWNTIQFQSVSFAATVLEKPELCTHLPSLTYRNECVFKSLGSHDTAELSDCSVLNTQTTAHTKCIENKVAQTSDPNLCLDLLAYNPSRFECVSGFVGSPAWQTACQTNVEMTYPSRNLVTGKCLTPETVDDLYVQSKVNPVGKPAWFSTLTNERIGAEEFLETVAWLKTLDFNPNTVDENGDTVLITLLNEQREYTSLNQVAKLVDLGVDVSTVNYKNESAADYAIKYGLDDVFVYLTSAKDTSKTKTAISSSTTYSDWTAVDNHELNIRFSHPDDWVVSAVTSRQTADGIEINELTVYPEITDPTRVHFFTTNTKVTPDTPLYIYRPQTEQYDLQSITLNGMSGWRRTEKYLNNNCQNELTIFEQGNTTYGSHIIKCPTHPTGYDQLREQVANSLEVIQ